MKVKEIWHYAEDDETYFDEPISVEIYLNNKLVAHLGSEDKSFLDYLSGFKTAVTAVCGHCGIDCEWQSEQVADGLDAYEGEPQ